MKVGLIGFGRAGSLHGTAAREIAAMELVVCDPSPECRARAEAEGLRTCAAVPDLLLFEEIEAAIVCTPPGEHVTTALACLARGIHVLCEKPLALKSSAAEALFAAANHPTRLAVASKFRHVPELQRARAMVLTGALGELRDFHISFCSQVDMSSRWNSQPHLSGGGVIADNASHVFDIAMYLFGALRAVRAIVQAPVQPIPVEDSASIQIQTVSGLSGSAEISWSHAAKNDIYVAITGSRATIEIGWRGAVLKHSDGRIEPFGHPYDRVAAHRNMHQAFCDTIQGRASLWVTARECLDAVAAVEACYRSLDSGTSEVIAPACARALPVFSESSISAAA